MPSSCHFGKFTTLDEKFRFLTDLCRKGIIVGTQASEVLTAGGDKHLMWVDIDIRNWSYFYEWERSSEFPFKENSYIAIPSTTGKVHLYVITNRPLRNNECYGMYEFIGNTMKNDIKHALDRVYGPNMYAQIYLPGSSKKDMRLPQHLLEEKDGMFFLPKLRKVSSSPSVWRKEKEIYLKDTPAPDRAASYYLK